MITITKDEWFNEWHDKVFVSAMPVIINFHQVKMPGVALEILGHLSKVTTVQVLNVDAKEFKFLARKCRKYHGLNGIPDIITVADCNFADYLFIKPFHETHPGTISSDIDRMIEDFTEFHLERNE